MERRVLQQAEWLPGLCNDPDLVAVLQVLAHAWKQNTNRNFVLFQNVAGSNPGQHQQLWRDVCSGGKDDLALRENFLRRPGRFTEPARIPISTI